jgi:hypothetical protein
MEMRSIKLSIRHWNYANYENFADVDNYPSMLVTLHPTYSTQGSIDEYAQALYRSSRPQFLQASE